VPSVPFLLLLKLPLRSTLFWRVSTSIHLSLLLVSKSFARICPVAILTKVLRDSKIDKSNVHELSWLVVQPVSPVSSNSFPTSSRAKSLTRASTLMRLLPMVPQSKLPSFPARPLRRLKTFSSMLPLFPLVLRQLVDCPHQA